MSQSPLFSRDELADSAFELLASSSVERYIRLAKGAADRSYLHSRLRQEPHVLGSALDRAQVLWKELLCSERREAAEFELAMLLPLLARASEPAVDGLLLRLATADRPNVAWSAALARRLLMGRSTNKTTATPGLDARPLYRVFVGTRNAIAHASFESRETHDVEISCRREQVSSCDATLVEAA